MEEMMVFDRQINSLRDFVIKRKTFLIGAFVVCMLLMFGLNIIASTSYDIECVSHCESTPHVACVGYWEISGDYPNCDCNYVCWEDRVCK